MKNPITAAKQKIEDHKVPIATAFGFAAGTVTAAVIISMRPTITVPPNMMIHLPQSIDEVKAVLDQTNGVFEIAGKSLITVITTDAPEEFHKF